MSDEDLVEKILNAEDEKEQLRLEKEAIEPTDNGWQEGDPEDQPDA